MPIPVNLLNPGVGEWLAASENIHAVDDNPKYYRDVVSAFECRARSNGKNHKIYGL